MYRLRSAIAHGDTPDFKKVLKSLKDRTNARSLLIRTVRAIARQALLEPQLVADLRECSIQVGMCLAFVDLELQVDARIGNARRACGRQRAHYRRSTH